MAVPLISDDIISFATRIGVTNSQEINWMMEILLSQRSRTMPFYDLIGGINTAKPIKEVMNFKTMRGQTIVLTRDRALGGSGTQGAATANRLLDNIEDNLHATFTASVGVMAHATGGEQVMKTQTVIGTGWDKRNKQKLKEWHANKKAEEIQWELIKRAHSRNSLFPNGKTTRDSLTSADTINLSTISRGKEMLASLQARPCAVGKTKAGAEILKYLWLTHNYALGGLEESPGYLNLLANAGNRGDSNYIFAGGQPEFSGNLIHSWNIEDGDHIGALAAPVAPRQYLGVELPANSVTTELSSTYIQAHASDTTAPFFQYFPAAACVGHEGTKIAATTTTAHVVGMKILTGAEAGKIALYAYKVNNGNKLTIFERLGASAVDDVVTTLTGTSITYGSGAWTSDTVAVGAVPVGSLIIPVNYKGQPWVTSFALGDDAILSGYGSLDANGAEVPGQRLVQEQDFGRLFALGYQDVWGCRAMENANNIANGYIKVESAYNPDGWPTIE